MSACQRCNLGIRTCHDIKLLTRHVETLNGVIVSLILSKEKALGMLTSAYQSNNFGRTTWKYAALRSEKLDQTVDGCTMQRLCRYKSSSFIGINGAGGGNRTPMSLRSPDFESGAYTNFATPASGDGNDRISGAPASTAPHRRAVLSIAARLVRHANIPSQHAGSSPATTFRLLL